MQQLRVPTERRYGTGRDVLYYCEWVQGHRHMPRPPEEAEAAAAAIRATSIYQHISLKDAYLQRRRISSSHANPL